MASYTIGVTAASEYDLSVERDVLSDLDVEFHAIDTATQADVIEEFGDVDAIIDRLTAVEYDAKVLDSLSACRVIARCGTGVDVYDAAGAAERGIYLVNVPEFCSDEVAEHALGLLLGLQRNIVGYDRALRNGRWDRAAPQPLHRLSAGTLGVVGYGSIGRRLVEKARGVGMDVVVAKTSTPAEELADAGVEKVSLETLLERADAVSLHLPLTPETEQLIDGDALARMRESAFLINTARGGLIDEEALVEALRSGAIAGAGLDVLTDEPVAKGDEPPAFESPLRELGNVVLTPHVGWKSVEADADRRRIATEDVRRILLGERPRNPVNDPR